MKRFRFSPFWHLTRWGFLYYKRPWSGYSALWPNRGCDEFHNPSRWIIVPLVGEFVWFTNLYGTDGPEHLHSYIGGDIRGWYGEHVRGCEICDELKRSVLDGG